MIKKTVKRMLPPGTKRNNVAKKIAGPVLHKIRNRSVINQQISYKDWLATIEPSLWVPKQDFKYKPLISIVVPTYNTPDRYIKPLIKSVLSQTYQNWQLCLVDGSENKQRKQAIAGLAGSDDRIKFISLSKNHGIAGNTNEGLKEAAGVYIAFLDHDDTLSPHALNEVVDALNKDRSIELIYSDEDKLTDNGKFRTLPFFKPDWSPELFLSVNYLSHFIVVKTSLVKKVKGLRLGYDGSQDYDFLLRVIDEKPKIYHIPKILYHWRLAKGSTARSIGEKNYADEAGRKALGDYLKRNNIKGRVVEIKDRPTNYRIKYEVQNNPLVSIIIPFKDKAALLEDCVESIINKTYYHNYEIILISNNSEEQATFDYLDSLENEKNVRIYKYNKPFNYSAINNFGRSQASGDYLFFLNNDMKILNGEWLEELLGVVQQPGVGAVGGWLFYPDQTTQHAGIILGLTGMAGHIFRMLHAGSLTAFGMVDWARNYLAVTGACLVIKADIFDKIGGFDDKFIMCGSDVTLCLKIYESGLRNIFWPYAKLTHFESQSVETYANAPKGDYDRSLKFYKPYLNGQDPYFNVNLSLAIEQISLEKK